MKGRFRIEPVAKTGIYHKRSPASSLNRLRTRDLAKILGHLSGRLAIDPEPAERLPGGRVEVGLHDGQQLLDDVLVMIPVPFAGEVAVRVGQPVEKPIRRVECGGTAVTLPRVVSDLVHRHLSKPRPKRALPPPVELGVSRKTNPGSSSRPTTLSLSKAQRTSRPINYKIQGKTRVPANPTRGALGLGTGKRPGKVARGGLRAPHGQAGGPGVPPRPAVPVSRSTDARFRLLGSQGEETCPLRAG
jgi:hypothetical protein